jgi:hypothetical protein
LDKYTNQPEPKVAAAVKVCVNVPLVMSISLLASEASRIVFDVLAERTMVGVDAIVVQLGKPDPALVNTCPLVPVAPAKVNAVVRLADAITGEVKVTPVAIRLDVIAVRPILSPVIASKATKLLVIAASPILSPVTAAGAIKLPVIVLFRNKLPVIVPLDIKLPFILVSAIESLPCYWLIILFRYLCY